MLFSRSARLKLDRCESHIRIAGGSDHIEGHLCASMSRGPYFFDVGLNFACDCNRHNRLAAGERDSFNRLSAATNGNDTASAHGKRDKNRAGTIGTCSSRDNHRFAGCQAASQSP
jgi:hypothetical protein